jgi:hypothetical protein
MKLTTRNSILIVTVLLFGTGAVSSIAAEGKFDKSHPRRAQVNKRLNNQNKRINKEVKNGQISKGQGAQMHKEDHQVRQEERSMASQNGGHITKKEQNTLNQQENGESKQIGK